jgi:hypothetical protein
MRDWRFIGILAGIGLAAINSAPDSWRFPLYALLFIGILALGTPRSAVLTARHVAGALIARVLDAAARHKRLGLHSAPWAGVFISVAEFGPSRLDNSTWASLMLIAVLLLWFFQLTLVATGRNYLAASRQARREQARLERLEAARLLTGASPGAVSITPFDERSYFYIPSRADVLLNLVPALIVVSLLIS